MKYFSFLLLLIIGCQKSEIRSENNSVEAAEVPYKEFLISVNKKPEKEKKEYFFKFINDDIPNYWISTPWSFDGTSRDPKKGSIACGYFVTNILADYGFKIKRIYLAQQASSVMIKQLCKEIQYFSKREDVDQYVLKKNKNQVYMVGLDFHTGFITRENKDTYFIHSNYINNKGVVKEMTKNSQALNASKTFMIGTLNY